MAADARGGERRARPRVQRGSRLLFLLGLFDFLLRTSVLGHVILPYKWIITAPRGNPKANCPRGGQSCLAAAFQPAFRPCGSRGACPDGGIQGRISSEMDFPSRTHHVVCSLLSMLLASSSLPAGRALADTAVPLVNGGMESPYAGVTSGAATITGQIANGWADNSFWQVVRRRRLA